MKVIGLNPETWTPRLVYRIILFTFLWLLSSLSTLIHAPHAGIPGWMVAYAWYAVAGVIGGSIGIVLLYVEVRYLLDNPSKNRLKKKLSLLKALILFCLYLVTFFVFEGEDPIRFLGETTLLSWTFAAFLAHSCLKGAFASEVLKEELAKRKSTFLYPAIGILLMSTPLNLFLNLIQEEMLSSIR